MKKTIINLLPIKTGGGLQNTLSFVSSMADCGYVFLVNKNSLLQSLCESKGFNYIAVDNSLLSRLIFEIKVRFLFPRNTVCFTYFGPPLLGSLGFFYNINGCAYSNLLHSEIDFWGWCKPIEKIKRHLIDAYRRKMLLLTDEVILETDLLLKRAKIDSGFKNKKLHVVKMSPSHLVTSDTHLDTDKYTFLASNTFKNILYISGAHPNKRLHLLPELALNLKKNGLKYRFILTLPECDYSRGLYRLFIELGVEEYYLNIGPVAPKDVSSLVYHSFAMINLALLESFSNNVVEAWALNKPILIPKEEWAQASCEDAACYVKLSDINSFVAKIIELEDENFYKEMIEKGRLMLSKMPSITEKNEKYQQIIKSAITK